jgi:hypothetical protein
MLKKKNILRFSRITWMLLLAAGLFFWESCQSNLPEEDISFNFHIRPILSNNCFTCHGPDPSSRKAGLRLDLRDSAIAVLESGYRAIVPGDWRQSELIKRIASDDPELHMPPPEMNKQLSEREIAMLKKWIQQGAEWEPYWAFVPPKTGEPPRVKNQREVVNDIDRYVLKEIEKRKLQPAPAADKATLLRRLSYLLTGLPPTPEELDAFLNDQSPDAYEKQVDRLLAAPRFGERWARHWMDLVRYAESRGHEFDYPVIGAWHYRDYLIRAFNADVPYDQLIREHLAGDLLETPRYHPEEGFNESILGTAYIAMSEGKHSPVDTRVDEAERIDNIIDVTTKTFQGLTVACAKCHDHKFDPIPTTDYYALYGIFESTRFTVQPAHSGILELAVIDSIEQYKKSIRQMLAEQALDDTAPLARARTIAQKFTPPPAADTSYRVIGDFRDGTLAGWLSNRPTFGNSLGRPIVEGGRLRGFDSAKASSRVLGTGILGALRSPTFTIDKDRIAVRAAGEGASIRIILDNFQLIQDPIHGRLKIELEEPKMKTYEIDVAMWKGSKAYVEILPGQPARKNGKYHDFQIRPDAWIEAEWAVTYDGDLPEMPAPQADDLPPADVALQHWVNGAVSLADADRLDQLRREGKFAGGQALQQWLERTAALSETLYDSTFFTGVTEGDAILSPVFIRGSTKNLSEEAVPHRFFTALKDFSPPFSQQGSARLDLANAIADPKNPLTARVMVNRLWHHLFGRGIVETVDNFGLQSKPPTHPELLDYLAVRFVEEGWSVKQLIRHIVLSRAFQRSTQATGKTRQADPQNLWLAHFPVRRLEGEAIRDGILAVSGRLDRTMYGESIPIHLTEFMKGRGRPPVSGPLDGDGRRSVYQVILRNFLPPLMQTFDMPVPFTTFGARNVSNVPAQSLTLMNDPFVAGQAAFWAERLLKEENGFEERIAQIYREAFARAPEAAEVEQAREFFAEQAALYKLTEKNRLTDQRPWADFCHAIFNMKEFVYLM